MSNKILIGSLDPSMSNFGVARMMLDLDTMTFEVVDLHTICTDRQAGKTVRQNSDDLRRCKIVVKAYHPLVKDCMVVFSEIPHGAQSARAMFSNGVVTALVASCPVPVIQVQAAETKMAAVGTKTASKAEMIEWANEAYPKAPFRRYPKDKVVKGKLIRKAGDIIDDEEHVADAVAVAHAGIKTDQFLQLVSMLRGRLKAA